MSIAVQVALVMVVLLVLLLAAGVPIGVGIGLCFRSFHDLHAAIQCSVCNIRTENFCRRVPNSFSLIAIPVFSISCRKHYE